MVSRPGPASLLPFDLPFDADPTVVALALGAVGVLAAVALLVVLRTRRQRAARGRPPAGAAPATGPASAGPGPAPAGSGVAPEAPGPDRVAPLLGYVPVPEGASALSPAAGLPALAPGAAGAPRSGPVAAVSVPDEAAAAPRSAPDPRAASSAAFAVAARRDISLLNRQLQALDELEQTETDPDTLQQLFLLDNLTMRLRRGAESLLVLAGSPPGRRVREAIPVSDVVRTASAQIEAYERVRVDLTDDPPLAAVHVVPVAHLLAELLENATVFSAPDTVVDVVGRCDPEAMHVTVRDSGLGMTADELERAGAALASRAGVSAGTDRLGLVVVGRIADRLGVDVAFASRCDGPGTEVTVRLARELFDVAGPDEELPRGAEQVLPEPVLAEPVVLPPVLDPDTLAPPLAGHAGLPPLPDAYVPERTADQVPGHRADVPGPRRSARSRAHAAEALSPEHAALPSFDAILAGTPGGDAGALPVRPTAAPALPAEPPAYGFVQPHPDVPHAPGSPAPGSPAPTTRRHAARPATEPVPATDPVLAPSLAPPAVPGPPSPLPGGPGAAVAGRTFLPQGPDPDAARSAGDPADASRAWTGEQSSLAERASLQQQALAALSSMSSYRPQVADTGGGTLARRSPAAVDAAADLAEEAIVRDAEALRARLTAFRDATRRGRANGTSAPLDLPAPPPLAEEMR
ncbi:ATP-binding protein [Cellulomonas sp. ACRRI]|uniref:ATP-binding protein n=1 Tax=Cellulomonas sp. ACRRI TaxID=2918188 RepID=UPI001EF1CA86|nr:ATP-binding protein [Cellulomonas sp. ACRRI]MCG7287221.1 ATP-binding protein [Cellulomonas sp. ACRRI]